MWTLKTWHPVEKKVKERMRHKKSSGSITTTTKDTNTKLHDKHTRMTAYRKRRERPPVIGTKETSWIFYIKCYDLRLMRANIFRSWSAGMASGTGSSRRQAMSPGSIALLCIPGVGSTLRLAWTEAKFD